MNTETIQTVADPVTAFNLAPYSIRVAEDDARRYFSDVVGAHGAFSDASHALDKRVKHARSTMAATEFPHYVAHLATYGLEA